MELEVWSGDWGLPSVDYKCLSVMAYCKFADIPVNVNKTNNPWKSPSGELPVLWHNDFTETRVMQIFEHLRKEGFSIDQPLTMKQSADTIAFNALCTEKLLPAVLHQWWIDNKTYTELTRPWYAKAIGLPLSLYLPLRKRNDCLALLNVTRSNGGLLTENELESLVVKDAKECLNILATKLGDNDFFFGDKPSSLDAVVFGYLATILKTPLPNTALQSHLKACRNLVNFCQKILTQYFPLSPEEQEALRKRDEEERRRVTEQVDFPNRRRNMALAGFTVAAAMLGYAMLTGLLQIEFINIDKQIDAKTAKTTVSPMSEDDSGGNES